PPGRGTPRRAHGALLSHARLDPGRRGRGAGAAPARVAEPRGPRGAVDLPRVAVPDRDQLLRRRPRAPLAPGPADGGRASGGPARRALPPGGHPVARAVSGP